MKKNKGFTLIELLAIIVILAIIAVITVPIILNIIENSRMGAATDSAYGFKESVNKYYVTKLSENHDLKLDGGYGISNGTTDIDRDGTVDEIPVSGEKASKGYLIYSNGVVIDGCLVMNGYEVRFTNGEATSTVKGDECAFELNVITGSNFEDYFTMVYSKIDDPDQSIADVTMESFIGSFVIRVSIETDVETGDSIVVLGDEMSDVSLNSSITLTSNGEEVSSSNLHDALASALNDYYPTGDPIYDAQGHLTNHLNLDPEDVKKLIDE